MTDLIVSTDMDLDDLTQLPTWPLADLLPRLDETEMERLVASIDGTGIRIPLILAVVAGEMYLLDGRNRREAARRLDMTGVPAETQTFDSAEAADEAVLALAVDRRSLSKQQLSCFAVRFWDHEAAQAAERQGTRTDLGANLPDGDSGSARSRLSKRFNVSEGYIRCAKRLLEIDEDTFEAVLAGLDTTTLPAMIKGKDPVAPSDPDDPEIEPDPAEPLDAVTDALVKARKIVDSVEKLTPLGKQIDKGGSTTPPLEEFQSLIADLSATVRGLAETFCGQAAAKVIAKEQGVEEPEPAPHTLPNGSAPTMSIHDARDFGRANEKGDCTVRAVAVLIGGDYERAHGFMAAKGRKDRCGAPWPKTAMQQAITDKSFEEPLLGLSFKWHKVDGKVPLQKLPLPAEGRFLIWQSRHVLAVIDGQAHDSGDFSSRKHVKGYWAVTPMA